MTEFLLYFVLPVLVAVVGVSAYYAIKDGNETRRIAEVDLPQQPAPIHDAQFYMKNGHWIFGVRSEDRDLQQRRVRHDEMEDILAAVDGPLPRRCHAEHDTDCGV